MFLRGKHFSATARAIMTIVAVVGVIVFCQFIAPAGYGWGALMTTSVTDLVHGRHDIEGDRPPEKPGATYGMDGGETPANGREQAGGVPPEDTRSASQGASETPFQVAGKGTSSSEPPSKQRETATASPPPPRSATEPLAVVQDAAVPSSPRAPLPSPAANTEVRREQVATEGEGGPPTGDGADEGVRLPSLVVTNLGVAVVQKLVQSGHGQLVLKCSMNDGRREWWIVREGRRGESPLLIPATAEWTRKLSNRCIPVDWYMAVLSSPLRDEVRAREETAGSGELLCYLGATFDRYVGRKQSNAADTCGDTKEIPESVDTEARFLFDDAGTPRCIIDAVGVGGVLRAYSDPEWAKLRSER